MDQITHAFGIDARLLTIQIINFGILMVALWAFLYKPLLRLIDERREKIEKGVHDAEAASRAKSEAEEERVQVLRKASRDADALAERARKDAQTRAEETAKEADLKAARMLAAAEKEGVEMKARALEGAKSELAKLIVLGAEKALVEKK